jgi:putative CocE/NonD family hydrolase
MKIFRTHMRTWLFVLCFFCAAFAQSLWAQGSRDAKELLSKPAYGVSQDVDVRVAMRDGVKLSTDLYLPASTGKFPTILLRTPYDNNGSFNVGEATYFAMRGYVVAFQDVRGRYDSEGEWVPARNEAKDGYDTIEWIAQQPWSDGKVGMLGDSYLGIVQLLAATQTPPHLVCIFPRVAYSDQYKQWTYTGGAFAYGLNVSWMTLLMSTRTNQSEYANLLMPDGTPRWWGSDPAPQPIGTMAGEKYWQLPVMSTGDAMGRHTESWKEWLRHPAYDDYWKTVSIENKYPAIAVPAYLVDGWYDLYNAGAPTNFNGIRTQGKTEAARKGTKLLMGPWVHNLGVGGTVTKVGDVDFGPNSKFPLELTALRWFDYWLKGIQNGMDQESPVKIFVMGENIWRDEQEWPLGRTQYTKYYLHSSGKANSLMGDGMLSTGAQASSEPPDTYTYDPRYPVPTLGGHTCCDNSGPVGPKDNQSVEMRPDVLVYTTPPLTEDVEVTGPVVLKLTAASSARDTDWTVKLVDVYPNREGTAINMADGILRARYRESLEKPALLEPGKVYEFTVDLLNTSNLFKKGHRIRIEISSSNFPQYDRNQNTGGTLFVDDEMVTAKQTIYHDSARSSYLLLPIIPRSGTPDQH